MKKKSGDINNVKKHLRRMQIIALRRGLQRNIVKRFNYICNYSEDAKVTNSRANLIIVSIISIFVTFISLSYVVNTILSARCLIPLNYLMWEAARPLADCDYCVNVTKPIILTNATRESFEVNKLFIFIFKWPCLCFIFLF